MNITQTPIPAAGQKHSVRPVDLGARANSNAAIRHRSYASKALDEPRVCFVEIYSDYLTYIHSTATLNHADGRDLI